MLPVLLTNNRVSSLLHQKPFLLSAPSTLSSEHDAIFVYSGNNDVIIPALSAILLPEKSRNGNPGIPEWE